MKEDNMDNHRKRFITIQSGRRIWAVLLMMLMHSPVSRASAETDRARISPEKPVRGTAVQFNYRTGTFPGKLAIEPDRVILLLYTDQISGPADIVMTKESGRWQAVHTVGDTTPPFLMYGFRIIYPGDTLVDDNGHRYWDILIYDTSGRPLQGAHLNRAMSYLGSETIRSGEPELAMREIDRELSLYPDNYTARQLKYTLRLQNTGDPAATRDDIKAEIKKILREDDSEQSLIFAIRTFRMIGENEEAAALEERLAREYPASEEAEQKKLESIMQIEDAEERIGALDAFLAVSSIASLREAALSSLAGAVLEADDSTRVPEVGDLLLQTGTTPGAAGALAGLAGYLADKKTGLQRASAYAEKAIDIVQNVDPALKPAQITAEDWDIQIRKTEARYRDILGWTYVQKGDIEKGLRELEAAAAVISQPTVYYHLGATYAELNRSEAALSSYAKAAAFGGPLGDDARQAFSDLWQSLGRDEAAIQSFLEAKEQAVDDDYRQSILNRRQIRPAPDFNLEDIRGGRVRLSDQNGTVVLLCFWGSWSRSSYYMLRDIQELAFDYGQDVLFLTIAVDRDRSDIVEFTEKYDLLLTTLINNETDLAYQLEGVPTVFVIDKQGRIHFTHRGFRPDIKEVLTIELEDLLQR